MTYADFICQLNRNTREQLLAAQREVTPEKLSTPVATWFSPDRLHHGLGMEFVVILRTAGCKYGRDPAGGCTMCGYLNDSPANFPTEDQLRSQFQKGWQIFLEKTKQKQLAPTSVAFKIFTSGSFFDPEEVPANLQEEIITQVSAHPTIAEVAVESRPEFVLAMEQSRLADLAHKKHLDIGVGLEAVTDAFRNTYIHKGFSYADFLAAHERIVAAGAGTKVYLTLKPPFASESTSIAEAAKSIQVLLDLQVDTISVNPVAVQKHTLVDSLFYKKQFRPPWLYSVLLALELGTCGKDLTKTRILCDPIAKGKERGAHNCHDIACNQQALDALRNAVETQKFQSLLLPLECWCKSLWQQDLVKFI